VIAGGGTILEGGIVKRGKRARGALKGRAVESGALAEVQSLLDGAQRKTGVDPRRRDLLIENLHLIQDRFGHIPAAHLVALAREMQLAMTEVYEVATFYHHFDVIKEGEKAPPALTVRVCDSLSCELSGSNELIKGLKQSLGDQVRVIPAPCVGRCEQAPVAVVGQNPVAQATVEKVKPLVAANKDKCAVGKYVSYAEYRKNGGYDIAIECLNGTRDAESLIKTMENSGLRGLGGAGFPSGRKWRIVRGEKGPRVMAINIDEGEPGTFKDRHYLERDPHRFLEGMIIAAWTVQISEVYIYLRDEYAGVRAILEKEIKALQANPPCPLPPIFLRRGAGAYICGEESAMIESIEGKRGMPRLRPPYVAQVGLFGYPTLEHNMETLYWVRDILEKGADWFAGHGRNGRKGLRSFSVSGRVKKPGVHLAPAGITVKELIAEYCGGMLPGHQFYGYLPGGASGGILPASMGDIPLDFDTLNQYGCFIGSAAVIIFSDKDKARGAARNVMKFFSEESCGQCTPCRVGTAKALQLMESPKWNRGLLEELSGAMADASICGLGQAAPNPIRTVMKYFPKEVE
jgi:NADH:ubiquinone oxidoreductase subunit F (NADH-binding)